MKRCLRVGDVFISEQISKRDKLTKKPVPCLVVKTEMSGGGYAQGLDYYPDGWSVTYVVLDRKVTYDSGFRLNIKKLKKYSFYQTGSFFDMIEPKDITLIGKMEMSVCFSWKKNKKPNMDKLEL